VIGSLLASISGVSAARAATVGTQVTRDPVRAAPSVSLGGTLYFVADDGVHGSELWKSDGTSVGTVILKDIRPGPVGSNPGALTVVGGVLFFRANDGAHGAGLWKSDGTTAGTILVKDIEPASRGSHPVNLVGAAGELFFRVVSRDRFWELWKSDGTAVGTVMLRRFPGRSYESARLLAGVGSLLFFRARSNDVGSELWRSDGSRTGTVLVKDIWPGHGDSFPGIRDSYASWGSDLYFNAWTASHGEELWRSDGTESGTYMLKDVLPGPFGSDPGFFMASGGALFFAAGDAGFGQLWRTDGTRAGTILVKDVVPGAVGLGIDGLADAGGTLFIGVDYESHGELWQSDGTTAGTSSVKSYPAGRWAGPTSLTGVGGTPFFFASGMGHGEELWRSDGTDAGTILVKDINPGRGSSVLEGVGEHLIADGAGTAFFAADDGTQGVELWKSDGTAAGTVLVRDVSPGSASSSPEDLVYIPA